MGRWLGFVSAVVIGVVAAAAAAAGALSGPIIDVPKAAVPHDPRGIGCCIVAINDIRQNMFTLECIGYLVTHSFKTFVLLFFCSRSPAICIRSQRSDEMQVFISSMHTETKYQLAKGVALLAGISGEKP